MTNDTCPIKSRVRGGELAELWRRLRKNRAAVMGAGVVGIFVLLAILAPLLVPYDHTQGVLQDRLLSPNAAHWFGTDELGRDLFSRILYGARISLPIGVSAEYYAPAVSDTMERRQRVGKNPSYQQARHADDAVHRRTDFVAHIGEEVALGPARPVGDVAGFGEFARLHDQTGLAFAQFFLRQVAARLVQQQRSKDDGRENAGDGRGNDGIEHGLPTLERPQSE